MDEETKRYLDQLVQKLDLRFTNLITESNSTVLELKEQVGINCTKLDNMDKKLDSIVEIVTANGQGIEVLSNRLDTIENKN